MRELAIVIVSYNVRELLRACLASLNLALSSAAGPVEIVVVDNASEDGTVAMVDATFPEVTLLASSTNLGFAAANNRALRHLGFGDPSAPTPEAVLLLNPDTVVAADAILQLRRALATQPQVVAVGPQLRYGDGSLQSSRRRFPTRATLFWESTLLHQWWPQNPWARRYHFDVRPAERPQVVDWLVGAALLVRGTAIQEAGLLDEQFFMYSEELEWQERLTHCTGGQVLYWPVAVVTHYEGKSSEQRMGQRLINFNRSKLRYARLRFGSSFARILAGFLRLTFGLQLMIEAGKWLLGHKRALRVERIKHYLQVLAALK